MQKHYLKLSTILAVSALLLSGCGGEGDAEEAGNEAKAGSARIAQVKAEKAAPEKEIPSGPADGCLSVKSGPRDILGIHVGMALDDVRRILKCAGNDYQKGGRVTEYKPMKEVLSFVNYDYRSQRDHISVSLAGKKGAERVISAFRNIRFDDEGRPYDDVVAEIQKERPDLAVLSWMDRYSGEKDVNLKTDKRQLVYFTDADGNKISSELYRLKCARTLHSNSSTNLPTLGAVANCSFGLYAYLAEKNGIVNGYALRMGSPMRTLDLLRVQTQSTTSMRLMSVSGR